MPHQPDDSNHAHVSLRVTGTRACLSRSSLHLHPEIVAGHLDGNLAYRQTRTGCAANVVRKLGQFVGGQRYRAAMLRALINDLVVDFFPKLRWLSLVNIV